MSRFFTLFFLLFLSAPICLQVKAQQSKPDSTVLQSAREKTISLYHKALGKQSHIFNGSEYLDYDSKKDGHQYFLTDQWTNSSIFFDGLEYQNIPLLYNLVTDDIIVGQVKENGVMSGLKISKTKVSSFDLAGNRFIHLKGFATTGLEAGFYQLLYKGETQVLAKKKKTYKKEVVIISFPEKNTYYLLKDGQYHVVKSKRSVLRALKEHKRELSQYLKANGIMFSQNREYAIAKLAEQYDLLNKAQ